MKPPRLRLTVRGMMIAVAVVSILHGRIVLSRRPDCRLRVLNRSGQSISRLAVTVPGETVVIEDLADGSSATVPFRGRGFFQFSAVGAIGDKTPIRSRFHIPGDPKRYAGVAVTVGPRGRFRMSLALEDE